MTDQITTYLYNDILQISRSFKIFKILGALKYLNIIERNLMFTKDALIW